MFAIKRSPLLGQLVVVALPALLVSCAGPTPAVRSPTNLTPAPAVSPGEAYRLALLSAGCWFGGVWNDVQGLPPASWKAATHRRCTEVVRQVYGKQDRGRYLQLRALEATVVDDVAGKVGSLAAIDPTESAHGGQLVSLVRAVAAAQRENMYARRAADLVKMDLAGTRQASHLAADDRAAVPRLRAHAGLESLLALQAGDLTEDANALGILSAMDRMELSRQLPRHLMVYAVEDVYRLLFGTQAPSVPADAAIPLQRGVWLGFLCDTARAAGYPVPETAVTPLERNRHAWRGVLEGFASKLRADQDRMSGDAVPMLRPMVRNVIQRIDSVYRLVATADKRG